MSLPHSLTRSAGTITRIAIGVVFILSGVGKLRSPYIFLANIYEYQLVGPEQGLAVAALLPWFEILIGICLVSGFMVGGALLGVILSCLVFVAAQMSVIERGLAINCGCFGGEGKTMVGVISILRTLTIALLSTVLYYFVSRHRVVIQSDQGVTHFSRIN